MNLTMEPVGDTGVILTRSFEARPEAVFSAFVTPKLISRWMLGPDGWHMVECRTKPEKGGEFLFVYTNDEGQSFRISGTYLKVDAPHLIRHREVMTLPDGEMRSDVETRFEPEGDGTRLRVAIGYAKTALRDAVVSETMKAGMEASYTRLDRLLSGTEGV